MTGFSACWLDLREAADARARNGALASALVKALLPRTAIAVADLGCGTGSNLRAIAPLLAPRQHWTLIDADQALLDAAGKRLAAWADGVGRQGDGLVLRKAEKRISVTFRRANLVGELEALLAAPTDLVTASALFDLVSVPFMVRLARLLAVRCAFYAVLTYDGIQRFEPPSEDDADLIAAFNAHQRGDKGFGPAAGPDAGKELAAALRAVGYAVGSGDSPWRLASEDSHLIAELVEGCANAAAETGLLSSERVARWRALRRTGALVGHTDILALPG
jgi:SAM-dependent methyltransferase